MLESYEEYLKRKDLPDKKESWISWKMDIYQYPKEKARKRAESQYYPLSPVDLEQTLVGLNIKHLRKLHGYTQKTLANQLGYKESLIINRWEKGIYIPDASQLNKLSTVFNISISDLLNKDLRIS